MGSSARQRLGSRNDFPHVRYLVHVRFPPLMASLGAPVIQASSVKMLVFLLRLTQLLILISSDYGKVFTRGRIS